MLKEEGWQQWRIAITQFVTLAINRENKDFLRGYNNLKKNSSFKETCVGVVSFFAYIN